MQVTINYLELSSTDLAASKTFFASAFGWGITDYGPGYAALDERPEQHDRGERHP